MAWIPEVRLNGKRHICAESFYCLLNIAGVQPGRLTGGYMGTGYLTTIMEHMHTRTNSPQGLKLRICFYFYHYYFCKASHNMPWWCVQLCSECVFMYCAGGLSWSDEHDGTAWRCVLSDSVLSLVESKYRLQIDKLLYVDLPPYQALQYGARNGKILIGILSGWWCCWGHTEMSKCRHPLLPNGAL